MTLREIEFCSNMDLSSGLEIRSTPCVASSASCHSIATFARFVYSQFNFCFHL